MRSSEDVLFTIVRLKCLFTSISAHVFPLVSNNVLLQPCILMHTYAKNEDAEKRQSSNWSITTLSSAFEKSQNSSRKLKAERLYSSGGKPENELNVYIC